ncbi:MAG: hypothetical protein JO291_06530, partial [Acidimicrobiia bacterium]|nr:hypothetical protein [Acidimicrobiia bacterium]
MSAAVIAAAGVVALPAAPASAHVPHDRIFSVAASPTFASDGTVYLISRNHLMRSTDGGLNWTPMVRGITGLAFQVAVAPADPEVLYMAMDGGISRSADRGSSWTRTNTPSTMSGIADIAISPRSSDVVFATGATTGLFRTTDGGATWGTAGSFGAVTALSVSADGRVIVGGSDGKVFTSTDDGATWVRSTGTVAEAATALVDARSTTFLGTKKGKVFRSVDGGRTFVKVGAGLPTDQITSITTTNDYATDHSVWVANWDLGVYRSTDRGAHFTKKSAGLKTNPQAPSLGKPQFGDVIAAKDGSGHQVL